MWLHWPPLHGSLLVRPWVRWFRRLLSPSSPSSRGRVPLALVSLLALARPFRPPPPPPHLILLLLRFRVLRCPLLPPVVSWLPFPGRTILFPSRFPSSWVSSSGMLGF